MDSVKKWGCRCMALLVICVLVAILMPVVSFDPGGSPRTQAKNDCVQLVNAIKGFYTEDGLYPTSDGRGMPVDRRIIDILTGKNTQENAHKIVFLEILPARKEHGKWVGGLNPETGAWVDPYGNPYWVKMDADYDNNIFNPYRANAGPPEINTGVIVWSAGKDGVFGNPHSPGDYKGSGDIISWQ